MGRRRGKRKGRGGKRLSKNYRAYRGGIRL